MKELIELCRLTESINERFPELDITTPKLEVFMEYGQLEYTIWTQIRFYSNDELEVLTPRGADNCSCSLKDEIKLFTDNLYQSIDRAWNLTKGLK